MSFDLTSIETELLQALGVVLLAMMIAGGRLVLKKLNIQLTGAQKDELEDVAGKAISAGIVKSHDLIEAKGWDHADVKNAVVASAVSYAIDKFPDAIKRAGINTKTPIQAAEQLADVMARKFPEAATAAAASPATPPAPIASGAVAAIVPTA